MNLRMKERKELYHVFQKFDKNHDDELEFEDFKRFLSAMDINPDDQTLKTVFSIIDKNKNGLIEFSEFYDWLQTTQATHFKTDKQLYRELFRKLDTNKDGKLDLNEFHYFLSHMIDPSVSPGIAKATFRAVDSDKNGYIEFEEFYSWLETPSNKNEGQSNDDPYVMCFRAMDLDNDGRLSYEEFEHGVREVLKLHMPPEEVKRTFVLFDTNKNNYLDISEWLSAVNYFSKKQ